MNKFNINKSNYTFSIIVKIYSKLNEVNKALECLE